MTIILRSHCSLPEGCERAPAQFHRFAPVPHVEERQLILPMCSRTPRAAFEDHAVYLKGSRHVPPRAEALGDAMLVLFDLLEGEDEPSARAVLGHWMVGYLHPYPDGNGRIARFLMNAMLASGGYPWTVIRVEDRDPYLSALETASVEGDIGPLARFLAERVRWSMEIAQAHR